MSKTDRRHTATAAPKQATASVTARPATLTQRRPADGVVVGELPHWVSRPSSLAPDPTTPLTTDLAKGFGCVLGSGWRPLS
jgi:hypothetical protein